MDISYGVNQEHSLILYVSWLICQSLHASDVTSERRKHTDSKHDLIFIAKPLCDHSSTGTDSPFILKIRYSGRYSTDVTRDDDDGIVEERVDKAKEGRMLRNESLVADVDDAAVVLDLMTKLVITIL